jgi:hypothetical protein
MRTFLVLGVVLIAGAALLLVLLGSPQSTLSPEKVPAAASASAEPPDVDAIPEPPVAAAAPAEAPPAEALPVAREEPAADPQRPSSSQPGSTIAGRVTNWKGEAVADASVEIFGRMNSSSGNAATDADGQYEVHGLDHGEHAMAVRHDAYPRVTAEGILSGERHADFVLQGYGSIEGRVFDAGTGQPVTKYQVGQIEGHNEPWNLRMRLSPEDIDDPEGRFAVGRVEPGDATVYVLAPGYAPGTAFASDVRPDQPVTDVFVRLEPGATIEGRVTDPEGQPIPKVGIFLPGWATRGKRTDAGGAFRLESIPLGMCTLIFKHADYASKVVEVRLKERGLTRLDVQLGEGATIEGGLFFDGEPVPEHKVFVRLHGDSGGTSRTEETDASGNYRVTGLEPGLATVKAFMPHDVPRRERVGWQLVRYVTVEQDRAHYVDLDIQPTGATLEGLVRVDGQAVEGATVQANFKVENSYRIHLSTKTDTFGEYRLEGIPVGQIELQAVYNEPDGTYRKELVIETLLGREIRHDVDLSRTEDEA